MAPKPPLSLPPQMNKRVLRSHDHKPFTGISSARVSKRNPLIPPTRAVATRTSQVKKPRERPTSRRMRTRTSTRNTRNLDNINTALTSTPAATRAATARERSIPRKHVKFSLQVVIRSIPALLAAFEDSGASGEEKQVEDRKQHVGTGAGVDKRGNINARIKTETKHQTKAMIRDKVAPISVSTSAPPRRSTRNNTRSSPSSTTSIQAPITQIGEAPKSRTRIEVVIRSRVSAASGLAADMQTEDMKIDTLVPKVIRNGNTIQAAVGGGGGGIRDGSKRYGLRSTSAVTEPRAQRTKISLELKDTNKRGARGNKSSLVASGTVRKKAEVKSKSNTRITRSAGLGGKVKKPVIAGSRPRMKM